MLYLCSSRIKPKACLSVQKHVLERYQNLRIHPLANAFKKYFLSNHLEL